MNINLKFSKLFSSFLIIASLLLPSSHILQITDKSLMQMHSKYWFLYDLIYYLLYASWGMAFALLALHTEHEGFRLKKTELISGSILFLYCMLFLLGEYLLITSGSDLCSKIDFLGLRSSKDTPFSISFFDLLPLLSGFLLTRGIYGEKI